MDEKKLCDGDGISSGNCLKAVSMSDKVCKVTVARPTAKAARDKGGHRVWYKCLKVQALAMSREVRAAPEPVIFHWKHECGGLARKGFKVGTVAGVGDVVKDGVVDKDWKFLQISKPRRLLPPLKRKKHFSMVDTDGSSYPSGLIFSLFALVYPTQKF